jgi:hypothetical protein
MRDGLVKKRKFTMNIIPANPGSGPGQAPVSRSDVYKSTGPRLSPG